MIRPAASDFPIRLMVLTSRLHETLEGAVTARIRPMRIRFAELSQFMQHYLQERNALEKLTQGAFYEYCGRLAEIAGGKDVTVLFAKMFADLLAGQDAAPSDRELPRNAPELMLSYLDHLNANRGENDPTNRDVKRAARITALECVREKFSARIDAVVNKLGADGEAHLDYLQRLGVVQSAGPAEDSVRFALDPVAEYLAAIEQIESAGDSEPAWRTTLKDLHALGDEIDRARGYIRALIDCIEHTTVKVPDFVVAELKQELEETKAAA